jgi:hypothetical protein
VSSASSGSVRSPAAPPACESASVMPSISQAARNRRLPDLDVDTESWIPAQAIPPSSESCQATIGFVSAVANPPDTERHLARDRDRTKCVAQAQAKRGGEMDDQMRLEPALYERATPVQPRAVVGLVLIVAGLIWAVARGLVFFGAAPPELGYDLDQPPVLLLLVGAWLFYKSRGR